VKEPLWIDEADALIFHGHLLGLDGGTTGLRDAGLLQSALAWPRQLYAHGAKPDVPELAAAYVVGIVANHPFVDGNKRTGFLLGVLFLELNGHRLTASEESATQAILSLASGKWNPPVFASWLRENCRRNRT
jgi:death on curing protein